MIHKKGKLVFLPISIAAISLSTIMGTMANAGSQGVDIYCIMRKGGNDHASSWRAAYQSLKNERGGLFKISPNQAATIIVQQVVGNEEQYGNCIKYLGELYPRDPETDEIPRTNVKPIKPRKINTKGKDYIDDRYSY